MKHTELTKALTKAGFIVLDWRVSTSERGEYYTTVTISPVSIEALCRAQEIADKFGLVSIRQQA